jgi:hypothetical protein
LQEAQNEPDRQEGDTLEREALKLEEKLRTKKRSKKGKSLPLHYNPHPKFSDEREHLRLVLPN